MEQLPLRLSSHSMFDPRAPGEPEREPAHAIHERLAERILPGLTMRMQRPRFLTAMAVGARVCEEFGDGELACDGITPPWLVFEWYAAEALALVAAEAASDPRGTGARSRLEMAPPIRRPLNAPGHLGISRAAGFSGIYRPAALGLRILAGNRRLDAGGIALLRAWEEDQELRGFVDGTTGAGARLRSELVRAVERGLTAGHPVVPRSDIHYQLGRVLWLELIGPRERRVLHQRLRGIEPVLGTADELGPHMRRELVDAVERRGVAVEPREEAAFLRGLRASGSAELATRLDDIEAYEALCEPLDRAAGLGTPLGGRAVHAPARPADLSSSAAAELAEVVRRAADRLRGRTALVERDPEVRLLVERFEPVRDGASLFEALAVHAGARRHLEVDRRSAGAVGSDRSVEPVRAGDGGGYLHGYRCPTLSRFVADVGRL